MINIIPNFMEEENINNLLNKYEMSKGEAVFEINDMARWPNNLYAGNFGPVYVLRLPEWFDYFAYKFSHIPQFENTKLNVCYMHIWQRGSGIRWHEDGNGSRIGATVYLNQEWNSNWGGLFLYEKNGHQSWYNPTYNNCVWFESPMWHSVSLLGSDIPYPRLSVQLFFDKNG